MSFLFAAGKKRKKQNAKLEMSTVLQVEVKKIKHVMQINQ